MSERSEQLWARMSGRALRACPACAGRHFYLGNIGLEQAEGRPYHSFDLAICTRCGRIDMFVDDVPKHWVVKRTEYSTFLEYQLPDPAAPPG